MHITIQYYCFFVNNAAFSRQQKNYPVPYQQHKAKHYGWWLCLHGFGLRRCKPLRGTEPLVQLQRWGRGDFRLTALWAASFHPLLMSSQGGHSAATRWSPAGCLPPSRRTWPGSPFSLPRQRAGGWCGVAFLLHELCRLRRTFPIRSPAWF